MSAIPVVQETSSSATVSLPALLSDVRTVLVAATTFLLMRAGKKLPEPLLILAAGVMGFLIFSGR